MKIRLIYDTHFPKMWVDLLKICYNPKWETFKAFKGCLKVHWCRFENLPMSSSLYENNMLKILLEHLLLFEICARAICEKFVYKHSETIEYAKN